MQIVSAPHAPFAALTHWVITGYGRIRYTNCLRSGVFRMYRAILIPRSVFLFQLTMSKFDVLLPRNIYKKSEEKNQGSDALSRHPLQKRIPFLSFFGWCRVRG